MTAPPQWQDTLSRPETVEVVQTCITERTPLAAIRLGEGEGRLLAANPDEPTSVKVAIQKLGRQTGLFFSPASMFKVKHLLDTALEQADIVGLQVSPTFAVEHREWGEHIASIFAERRQHGKTTGMVSHCLFNVDLENALPTLLAAQRQLSIISSRDIAPILEKRYGLKELNVYQVPSEYVVRDVDDKYEQRLHNVPIWPDLYYEIRESLDVRTAGEVFLVGAGVFAKELCVHIRDLGGIALDMGSSLDRIANKVTRGAARPTFKQRPEVPVRV